MPIVLDGSNGITQAEQFNSDSTFGFKNRIINGAMVIDQRNAGAAVTVNSTGDFFPVDRFAGYGEVSDGVYTLQRSSVAPAGFVNSILATVTTADASVGASQYYFLQQKIEGFNVADLGFGTANAKTVTLSFWVRSSLTGTFGGSIANSAFNRSYPFSYNISAANTWEQKSITVPGDTTGTWLTTNGIGLRVYWDFGSGSDNVAAAGSWVGAGEVGATGGTRLISTLGATFYITGVQLEVGSTATSFDYRPYGTELALAQRYYYQVNPSTNYASYAVGTSFTSTLASVMMSTPTMRSTPSFSYVGALALYYDASGNLTSLSAISLSNYATNTATLLLTGSVTTGRVILFATQNSTATALQFSAEL